MHHNGVEDEEKWLAAGITGLQQNAFFMHRALVIRFFFLFFFWEHESRSMKSFNVNPNWRWLDRIAKRIRIIWRMRSSTQLRCCRNFGLRGFLLRNIMNYVCFTDRILHFETEIFIWFIYCRNLFVWFTYCLFFWGWGSVLLSKCSFIYWLFDNW